MRRVWCVHEPGIVNDRTMIRTASDAAERFEVEVTTFFGFDSPGSRLPWLLIPCGFALEVLAYEDGIQPGVLAYEDDVSPEVLAYEDGIQPGVLAYEDDVPPGVLAYEDELPSKVLAYEDGRAPEALAYEYGVRPGILAYEDDVPLDGVLAYGDGFSHSEASCLKRTKFLGDPGL
nr:hypothetical protein CFP56_62790 [Quercus suber]